MAKVLSTIRVRYADTDAMGVVYHANYLVWFEVGRGDFMREVGIPYTEFEKRGIFVPVIEAHLHYKASGRYDEVLTVETTVAELSAAKVKFGYRIMRDADLLCEGYTVHGFVAGGRPVALPKAAPDLYEGLRVHL
ncbi:MAG TPA: thioesterase family protein [Symbiobacteriaceae bacterium]|nr:thioesterase family protein [Symbiobacteriaceae bacterium]